MPNRPGYSVLTQLLILLTALTPGQGWAAISSVPSAAPTKVGILRIGNVSGADAVTLDRITQSLKQYVENISGGKGTADTLADRFEAPASTEALRWEQQRTVLENETAKAVLAIAEGDLEQATALVEKMKRARNELAGISWFLPSVQKALVTEAALKFKLGNREAAKSLLGDAAGLHPEGRLVSPPVFGPGALGFDTTSFANEAREIRKTDARLKSRACVVKVDAGASEVTLFANGFAMGSSKEVHLLSGFPYRILAVGSGLEPAEKEVVCRGQEVKQLSFNLRKRTDGDRTLVTPLLGDIGKRRGVKTLLLVHPVEDRLKLFLFTPGFALDEVPLNSESRLADLREAAGNGKLPQIPIATDAFLDLLTKHQGEGARLAMAGDFGGASGVLQSDVPASTPWYNSWEFWTVVGIAAGGAAAALLLTRGDQVGSQPMGISIKIK